MGVRMAAPGHPKTKELRLALGCSLPQTIGHLELMWHFCAQHSSAGDIGKWSDAAIAEAAGWPESEPVAKFIDGLVATGWLEHHSVHRLIVHDWRDHAPGWVAAKLKKLKLQWVASEKGQRPLLGPTTPLSSPSLTSPEEEEKDRARLPDWLDVQAWEAWVQHRREIKKKLTPLSISRQLKFLERHQQDHVAIINESIKSGWTGLFELKGGRHGSETPVGNSARDRVARATAAHAGDAGTKGGGGTVATHGRHVRSQVGKPVR